MCASFRKIAKKLAYFAGPLPIRHRSEHRHTLTVVMFHRVLDREDARWADASPVDTVTSEFFVDCLRFFRRHYHVVPLSAVVAASRAEAPLPPRSLLITFDDGWADNLQYAAPLLRREGLPAVIFVAAEPVLSSASEWWQERLFGAWRTGVLTPEQRARIVAESKKGATPGSAIERPDEPEVLNVVARLCGTAPAIRDDILATLPHREGQQRMMLTTEQLPSLATFGVALGVHGYSHAPLTMLGDPAEDLRQAREALARTGHCQVDVLAYPHGRFDDRVQGAAEQGSFMPIFTSRAVINRLTSAGYVDGHGIGRIPIDQQLLAGRTGRLLPEELATSLFLRATE